MADAIRAAGMIGKGAGSQREWGLSKELVMRRDGERRSDDRGPGGSETQQRPFTSHRRPGFTLTELLVVVGLIAVLISLLLPVLSRVRASANSAACLANLRQMTITWNVYLAEHKARFPEYLTITPAQPEVAYRGYWLGILERYRVQGDALLCPAAPDPIPYNQIGYKGAGNVNYAWNGKFMSASSVTRLNSAIFRVSSYGYNRRLSTEGIGGYGVDGRATRISQVKNLTEVPVFFDSTMQDSKPANGSLQIPVQSPNDLRGDSMPVGAPDHWRFLIARHGRAINVAFADGSARRVPLEEIYMLQWTSNWEKYSLHLPPF